MKLEYIQANIRMINITQNVEFLGCGSCINATTL